MGSRYEVNPEKESNAEVLYTKASIKSNRRMELPTMVGKNEGKGISEVEHIPQVANKCHVYR